MSELGWKTDVRLACAGDKDAFSRLVKETQGDAYRLAKSILRSDEECADAMQEAILKAYKAIPKLKEPDFFRTWFYRILIRECQMTFRRRKRTVSSDRLPEGAANAFHPDLDLREAVNRLDEDLRTLVKLHYYADLPLGEISAMLDVSEGTLKSRLHRARRKLAAWLGNDGGNDGKGEIGYEH